MELIFKLCLIGLFVGLRLYRLIEVWDRIADTCGTKEVDLPDSAPLSRRRHDAELVRLLFIVVVLWRFLKSPLPPVEAMAVGAGVYLFGLSLAIRARVSLGRSWADILHLPATTEPLVLTGPYRWCRNPMYVAFGVMWTAYLVTFGWSLWSDPFFWVAACSIGSASFWEYHAVVRSEEHELLKRFGRPYERYCRIVPRYLPLGPFKRTK